MGKQWLDQQGKQHSLVKGVDVRGGTISIRFRWKDRQYREMKLEATPENLRLATAKLASVKAQIQLGTFDHGREFPASASVKKQSSSTTVKQWCEAWLARKANGVQASSLKSYTATLEGYWYPTLGLTCLVDLTPAAVIEVLDKAPVNRKTIQNIIAPFRQAMKSATMRKAIAKNPFTEIDTREIIGGKSDKKRKHDPYDVEERSILVATAHPLNSNVIDAWFYIGLRPEEMIALMWDCVDLKTGMVTVRRIVDSLGTIHDRAKTLAGLRDVPLPPPAIKALERQMKVHALAKPKDADFVFIDPATSKRFANTLRISQEYWLPLSAAAQVRYRGIGQIRHSYANMMLERDEKPRNIAAWMGHTDVVQLYRVYGKEKVLGERKISKNSFSNAAAWE